ncbi:hypothetical protein Ciccas_011584 [Cichlidogyrus casuarinus]|uniref:mRNA export factor n=1 Tax=Cichlidogyrus casuarinus TaxID=1844966 RepID=A0ABD2PS45_9PLAT
MTLTFGGLSQAQTNAASNKTIEVNSPPSDAVSSLNFSPEAITTNTYLSATSWDCRTRVWEITGDGNTVPKAEQTQEAPVLSSCWSKDGSKIFTVGVDKKVMMWDLGSNQMSQIGSHDAPIKTAHFIQCPQYTCLMTGGWDKKLKFWDCRTPNPILVNDMPERVYCADVFYPLAVVVTASREVVIYNLENHPKEFNKSESPLKYQSRCVSIFLDKNKQPTGYALGSIEGRSAIQYLNPSNPKDNFTFKCHRSNATMGGYQEVFPVNDIVFHPIHGTLATVGSDGRYAFWDKDARTKLTYLETAQLPLTSCAIDAKGQIFAYAACYDWSQGHEFNDPSKPPKVFLRTCMDEMRPNNKR